LCIEEQFYSHLAVVVFSVRSRRALLWICASVVVLAPLLRIVAQDHAPNWMLEGELLYRATPFQLDALLVGGLVALLLRGQRTGKVFEISAIIALFATFSGRSFSSLVFSERTRIGRAGYGYGAWKFTWGLSFVDLFAAAIIVCALKPSSPIYRLLSLRPLRWIGRISYGAYVFHDIFHGIYRMVVAAVGTQSQFVANMPKNSCFCSV